MACCEKWKPAIVILSVYFVMAVLNILFKEVLNEGQSILVFVTYRLIAAGIFLTPIAYFYERRSRIKLTIPILCQLFFSALFGATLTQYLFLVGVKYTSAAFASAFTNMTPVFTFILAFLLRQERVNLRSKSGMAKVLGSLICTIGVIVLILFRGIPLNKGPISGKSSHAISTSGGAERWVLGSTFLVISILCWSAWFLIQARIGKTYQSKYSSTALMSFFGALQSAVLCLAINRDVSVWIVRGRLKICAILSAGVLGSGLCYVAMSWCVEKKGPVFTSAFTPFIQIFIIILDLAFYREQIYLGSVIGSILVIGGLFVLLWGKSREVMDDLTNKAGDAENGNVGNSATTTSDVGITPVA